MSKKAEWGSGESWSFFELGESIVCLSAGKNDLVDREVFVMDGERGKLLKQCLQ